MAAHLPHVLISGLVLGGLLCFRSDSSEPPSSVPGAGALIEANVTRVIDGNSLEARVHDKRTAVGYLGVATPAVTEPCGPEALDRNRELAGARVMLEEDPAYQFGELGKRLYYAYTPEGQWVDEILVREGLGRAVRTGASRGAYLAAVQADAEAARSGCLWGSS